MSKPDEEHRFASAVDAAGMGVWDWDPVTDELWLSPRGKAMLGLAQEEEPGGALADWERLAHPEDWNAVAAAFERLRAGRSEVYDFTGRWRHQDGRWVWIQARGEVVAQDRAGKPSRVMGVILDVTDLKDAHEQLAATSERLQLAMSAGRIGTFEVNYDTGLHQWDEPMLELYGIPAGEFDGRRETWLGCIHPDDRARVLREVRTTTEKTSVFDSGFRILHARTGEVRHIHGLARVIPRADGSAGRTLGINWDITEHKRLELALHEEKTRLQVTLHSIGDAVICADPEARVTYMNPIAEAMSGWSAGDAVGRPLREIFRVVDEAGGEPPPDPVAECLARREPFHLRSDAVLLSRGQGRVDIEATAAPVHAASDEVIGAVLVFRDTRQARALRRELEHHAHIDSLTDLPNRRALERELHSSIAEAGERHRHVLCFIDLDRFKLVNDGSGHSAGDALLRQVAELLRRRKRRSDVAARIGGDEFVLLLRDCTSENGMTIARQLCDAIAQIEFRWRGKRYDVGASIGLTAIDRADQTPDELIGQADAACYAAKALSGTRVARYEEREGAAQQYRRQIRVVTDIRDALDDGRFRLFAQEIRDLKDRGAGKYFEILLRMYDTNGTLERPGEFIPAAERYGQMVRLDRWVIETLLREHGARIAAAGAGVAVNLSGKSLSDPDLWPLIERELAAAGLAPGRLHLEITETAVIDKLPSALAFIEQARAAGCGITLDDFGAGLSSFAYLRQIHADTIKIDGSFIKQLASNRVDRAIIEAIHDIARHLDAVTVAEHVEDDQTLELVREIGVDHAQGYAIAHPLPLAQVL